MKLARLGLFASLTTALGCASWLPAPVPMKAIDHSSQSNATPQQGRAHCLVVFLPGAGDAAEYFEQRGFVDEVRRRKLSIDMVAANATMGYYFKGILSERLFKDVVHPRMQHEYAELWLVGMSMGGMGTLLYSHQRPPGEVTGLIALAPYLGDSDLLDEIRSAGGLARWKAPAPAAQMNESNYQRELWRWLKAVTEGREPGPKLYLGYGRSDKLAGADALLGAALPSAQVLTTEGKHDWPTWRGLFSELLDHGALSERCRQ